MSMALILMQKMFKLRSFEVKKNHRDFTFYYFVLPD